ncbi:MAG: ATP-binding cassette domain-containing protein, partial [Pseudonocardiaceae bacterium]
MSAIVVQDLVVSCCGRGIVGPLSFEVASGAILGVSGPSGAGKSTALRALVGLLPPALSATGQICVLGVEVGG